jgi:uncharacterized protein YidB (DUF937 family)
LRKGHAQAKFETRVTGFEEYDMTLSPLLLLLLGVLAYRTYKGKGRLAEMLRNLGGAAPEAASAPPAGGYPQRWPQAAPAQSARPMGVPPAASMAPPGARGPFGGSMGGFAGGLAGGLIGSGLHDLLNRFQHNGYGDVANSWVGTGPNRTISPDELQQALGPDTVNSLANEAGLSDIDVLSGLSRDLPAAVDDLTPTGQILDDYGDFGGNYEA